jgi:amino acid transporter
MSRAAHSVLQAPRGLDRKTLTGPGLFFFAISASAPMTVVAGGIVTAFAGTGIVGVPAAFAVLTVALMLFSVGYVSMARHVPHAGPLYAHVARGLGPARGLAAAAVALLSYNAIEACLFGLLGATLAGMLGGYWWVWALAAWGIVGVLGVLHVRVNAQVLAVALVCEIGVVIAFDLAALLDPAGGELSLAPLLPANLFGDGVGGVLALAVACFVGYESTLAFAEEARTHKAVTRASFAALLFLGTLYTVSAWAIAASTGADRVATASTDLIFGVLDVHYGRWPMLLAQLLLVSSILAAMISFHQTIARYLFVLTRERLLPPWMGLVRRRSGVPVGGSLLQSAVALSAIAVWALLGADPMVFFTYLAALAAIGLMSLMALSCLAVLGFYRRGGGANESGWIRVGAPLAGGTAMLLVVAVTVSNLHSLTGAQTGSASVWLLPGLVVATAAAGLAWGVVLRARRGDVVAGLGKGETEPLAEIEHHLTGVDI